MVKQKHQLFVILLCAADGIVALAACYAAWAARLWKLEQPIPADFATVFRFSPIRWQ